MALINYIVIKYFLKCLLTIINLSSTENQSLGDSFLRKLRIFLEFMNSSNDENYVIELKNK
jgi:hypothetical protein